jgi:hypothetical protein
MINLRNLK